MHTLETLADYPEAEDVSEKSRAVTLALCTVLGWAGGHRFYVGKVGTGILQMLTVGGLGLWYLYDLILVASGTFKDKNGRRVEEWGENEHLARRGSAPAKVPREIIDELYALRADIEDLNDRVEFAERLLAKGRDELT